MPRDMEHIQSKGKHKIKNICGTWNNNLKHNGDWNPSNCNL